MGLDDQLFCDNLVLDSESRSFSFSGPSSPDSPFSVSGSLTPYEGLTPSGSPSPSPNPSSAVPIAIQPEFGSVQPFPISQQYNNPFVHPPQQQKTQQQTVVNGTGSHEDEPKTEKKRKRDDLSAILPRDVLLKISSKEYEDTIKNIEKQRPLTQSEQQEVQRQRKKVRNREYAQNCRSKKKQLLESCQDANDRLTQEKMEMHNALMQVQRDNQRLLNENAQMKFLLSSLGYTFASTSMPPPGLSYPMATQAPPPVPSMPSTTSQMTTINFGTSEPSFTPINYSTPQVPIIGEKTNYPVFTQSPLTTICLFAIIFSFGFFFGGSIGSLPFGQEKLVIESRGRSLFEAEAVIPLESSEFPVQDAASNAKVVEANHDCNNSTSTEPCPLASESKEL
eukprot:TRINITY_DN8773_c0_g1_i2.p1 TRINITY_DN8773_c0_g1~~TRINITY_DN8773_c0_g1_i2.p1  ORF type:complete len:413 (-),score=73.31 TRINITY_DN8773_c0_g1_i2:39-1217(-)